MNGRRYPRFGCVFVEGFSWYNAYSIKCSNSSLSILQLKLKLIFVGRKTKYKNTSMRYMNHEILVDG